MNTHCSRSVGLCKAGRCTRTCNPLCWETGWGSDDDKKQNSIHKNYGRLKKSTSTDYASISEYIEDQHHPFLSRNKLNVYILLSRNVPPKHKCTASNYNLCTLPIKS